MARKSTSGFKYSSSQDAIEEALAEIGGGNFFKAKEGKNIIRILPPYNDSGKFFFKVSLYNGFKKDGKNVAIPLDSDAGAYIAKKLNELASEGAEGAALAKRYGVRTKYFMNVIDRSTGAVKIWGCSGSIMKELGEFYKDDVDGGKLDDPQDGHDVIIERTGKGMNTRYSIRFRPRPSPALEAGEEAPELFNLEEEVVHDFTIAEAKGIWNETFADVEGEGKSKVSDEDDIDNDIPKEDEDEPSVKKKKAVVEEDEDEEDEDLPAKKKKVVEEDEEPTPARRNRREAEEEAPRSRRRR